MPKERRTQLFSATMTSKVAKLQRACLDNPVKVEVDTKYRTVDTLRQQYLFIPAKHKVELVIKSPVAAPNLPCALVRFTQLTGCIYECSEGCVIHPAWDAVDFPIPNLG